MYRNRELPGFAHLYIGEEATAIGVMAHLRQDDWITSTHRGHGHALAKGVPPKMLLAELAGKATGCNGGRGGTMHVYMPSVGLLGTNGLVGGGIPAAVGLAISAKTRGTDQVAVSFFGDGATSHGAFHESLNFAGIQNAPGRVRLRKQSLRHRHAAAHGHAEHQHRQQGGVLRLSRRARRRQRRAGRLEGGGRSRPPGTRRRGADADRSADLSPGGPSGRRPGRSAGLARRRNGTSGSSAIRCRGIASSCWNRATPRKPT